MKDWAHTLKMYIKEYRLNTLILKSFLITRKDNLMKIRCFLVFCLCVCGNILASKTLRIGSSEGSHFQLTNQ